jgi:hypothetical protein
VNNLNFDKLLFFELSVLFGQLILPLENDYWHAQFYPIYGRCFTYDLPPWLRDLKVLDIVVELYLDSFVFLHHPGD